MGIAAGGRVGLGGGGALMARVAGTIARFDNLPHATAPFTRRHPCSRERTPTVPRALSEAAVHLWCCQPHTIRRHLTGVPPVRHQCLPSFTRAREVSN